MNSPLKSFRNLDVAILCTFAALITFQPFFLHGEVIMMETGIHLPALSALFHGAVPYRDFFYLRGPLELYVPAALMMLFGKNMALLPVFYYAGTILTLFVCVLVARNLYRVRFVLYLAIVVLIARTFPRVSYNYWGGMRYALGLLSVFFAIIYFKKPRARWIFLAGVLSALSFLTTIEAGLSASLAIIAAFIFAMAFKVLERKELMRPFGCYVLGGLTVIVPVAVYFYLSGALVPFLETSWAVATRLTKTFIDAPGNHPESPGQFFAALVPSSPYFKFMTPVYFYAAFLIYLFWRIRRKAFSDDIVGLVCLAVYGIILYIAAFRKIEGHHFEMALQPEKLLFFYLAQEIVLHLKAWKDTTQRSSVEIFGMTGSIRAAIAYCFIFVFIASSVGYSVARYNSRFPAFQLMRNFISGKHKDLSPLAGQEKAVLDLDRAKGLVVPRWQEEEMRGVTDFLLRHSRPGERVFTFPELGDYNFLADRPFIGKFPIATFSWIQPSWSEELIKQLQDNSPRYIVMTKLGHRTFPEVWYFRNPENKEYFQRVTSYILAHYKAVQTFDSVEIYQLNKHN
ncbi:MAG TPA: hypothetical protein PKO44_04555 [Candidatus Omnitrophota bacterium]|nr:hypothetical protein [Candidatus Omnitrophota bacterium]